MQTLADSGRHSLTRVLGQRQQELDDHPQLHIFQTTLLQVLGHRQQELDDHPQLHIFQTTLLQVLGHRQQELDDHPQLHIFQTTLLQSDTSSSCQTVPDTDRPSYYCTQLSLSLKLQMPLRLFPENHFYCELFCSLLSTGAGPQTTGAGRPSTAAHFPNNSAASAGPETTEAELPSTAAHFPNNSAASAGPETTEAELPSTAAQLEITSTAEEPDSNVAWAQILMSILTSAVMTYTLSKLLLRKGIVCRKRPGASTAAQLACTRVKKDASAGSNNQPLMSTV
ncbi:uncharacterized protein LOC132209521 [Stegostoma tigrinum]|uniref:uncharacterized protein LOC132209521 n=1 Tax=Stegostoma tigrinum TaxID=3053191 RepID=UPI0028707BFA|nr:uncharacterized protein LOC132209521 [Stegostoma tigrinum]